MHRFIQSFDAFSSMTERANDLCQKKINWQLTKILPYKIGMSWLEE